MERLEHEQIDAAFEKPLDLFAEILLGLVHAGLAPRLDADAERTDGARDEHLIAGGMARDRAPWALIALTRSPSPNGASLTRFAPKVLVSITSAPART